MLLEKEEQFKQFVNDTKKEQALNEQKFEFYEMQLTEAKQREEETNRAQE